MEVRTPRPPTFESSPSPPKLPERPPLGRTKGTLPERPPPDPDLERIEEWFTHHRPTEEQRLAMEEIRSACRVAAKKIVRLCPSSADRTAALRSLRLGMMQANASIVCRGK